MAEQNPFENLNVVLAHYSIEPIHVRLLDSSSDKNEWLIETSQGKRILTQQYIRPERMMFIAGAHWHLQKNGFPIARLIPAKGGGLILAAKDHVYTLCEAVEGRAIQYYDKSDLLQAMENIARFQAAAIGYVPAAGSKSRKRVGKWEKMYRWKLQELENNKQLAARCPDDPFSALFLEHADNLIARGKQALNELQQPVTHEWIAKTVEESAFCHQDVTLAHVKLIEGKPVMQDLHSITRDLPCRDLRVILNKVMKKRNVWDETLACDLLHAYDAIHPLKKEYYQVLWTDLKFPHLFAATIHKYYLSQKKSWSHEKFMMNLKNVLAVEQSKDTFLNHFDESILKIKGDGGHE